MARLNLGGMSLEALIDLRDTITSTLTRKAADLQRLLSRITRADTAVGPGPHRARKRSSTLKGRKVAPKYRSKKNPKLTWAGRGAVPRWMRDEMKARKLKKQAFLIK